MKFTELCETLQLRAEVTFGPGYRDVKFPELRDLKDQTLGFTRGHNLEEALKLYVDELRGKTIQMHDRRMLMPQDLQL